MSPRHLAAGAALLACLASPAQAQIAVIDWTAIGKQIEQIREMGKQLDTLNQQLTQLESLHGSLSKITNMADVAGVLNDPQVRRALPGEFSQIEGLMRGQGGSLQGLLDKHLDGSTYYESEANTFYAQEVARSAKEQAGAESIGEQIYQAASKRISGIDQLRLQISSAKDSKDALDLIARLNAEQSFLQVDVLRMQALTMVQRARADVAERRREEARLKFQDEVGQRIKSR
jgi:type IV secretion system protein VirB5